MKSPYGPSAARPSSPWPCPALPCLALRCAAVPPLRWKQDGAGPASVSELVDFLGVLKRFSEDQLERSKKARNGNSSNDSHSNRSPDAPAAGSATAEGAAGEAEAEDEDEEEAACGDEMEGVEQGGCDAAGEKSIEPLLSRLRGTGRGREGSLFPG